MPTPVVATRSGRVRGHTVEGASAYLGIPFAAPPVGAARFAPPGPVAAWAGTRECTAYGPTALQPARGATLVPEPTRPGDESLNLNVFTPEAGQARLPVLVWIHGGGFTAGCNSSPWYGGTRFARDGVVLVSVNYRLGVEGFLYVADAPAPVNRGVLDWLAALEWVQENIDAADLDSRAREFRYPTLRGRRLRPCVDGDLIPCDPFAGVRSGVGGDIDLLIGCTAEEFNHTFRREADSTSVRGPLEHLGLSRAQAEALCAERAGDRPGEVLGQAVSDAMFRAPAALLAEARVAGGSAAPTYAYEFRWRSPAQDGLLGACHCMDIPFVFDLLGAEGVERVAGASPPPALADAMHAAFVAFAQRGDPGWPAYDLQRRPTMLFDTSSGVADDPLRTERLRWAATICGAEGDL